MHIRTLVLRLVAPAAAFGSITEADYPFQARQPGDLRSPCPALNTLANHGFIPHDGRNIDLETIGHAVSLVFNMPWDTMLVVGEPALATSTTGNSSTFNLNDTVQHMPQEVEHDASLTRDDAYFGDALTFSPQAWGRTLASWGDIEIVDFEAAAKEIKGRFDWGAEHNPEFNATFAKQGALLQYSLLLGAFGKRPEGNANKSMVKYWIENERLPLHMGWQPPMEQSNLTSNLAMAAKTQALWDELEQTDS